MNRHDNERIKDLARRRAHALRRETINALLHDALQAARRWLRRHSHLRQAEA